MAEVKFISKNHIHCAVCGKSFNSTYDEELKAYPIYHIQDGDDSQSCECRFFSLLMRIYLHLHRRDTSIQMDKLLSELDWQGVQLRKESVLYCLKQGYLTRDDLKRIIVPEAIHDINKDLFTAENLTDPNFLKKAIEYIKSALIVLRDKLAKPKANEEEPQEEISAAEEIKSQRVHRMATIEMTLSSKKGTGFNLEKARRMYSR